MFFKTMWVQFKLKCNLLMNIINSHENKTVEVLVLVYEHITEIFPYVYSEVNLLKNCDKYFRNCLLIWNSEQFFNMLLFSFIYCLFVCIKSCNLFFIKPIFPLQGTQAHVLWQCHIHSVFSGLYFTRDRDQGQNIFYVFD